MNSFVKLKLIRTQNKLTQEQVASALGISRSAYCGYEIGRRKMSTDMLTKLASFYRIPASAFFEQEDLTLRESDNYNEDSIYLSTLSDEERDLIVKFRVLEEDKKEEFLNTIKDYSKGEK